MTFFCIFDVKGPLLLEIEIKPSSRYIAMLFKFVSLSSVSKMYIPTGSAIWGESDDPMVTSKLSVSVFTQEVSLLCGTDFLLANIMSNSSGVISV